MTQHTPTPYSSRPSISGETTVIAAGKHKNYIIASVAEIENAEFIVRACNARDELVAALGKAKIRLQNCYNTFSHPNFTDRYGDADNTKVVIDIIDAALAKAKGE